MKQLHIECNMGVAGDMLTGALYELLSPEQKKHFISKMNNCGLENVKVEPIEKQSCGIVGTKMQVIVGGIEETPNFHKHHNHCHDEDCHEGHSHEHAHIHNGHNHSSLQSVISDIDKTDFPDEVKCNAKAVYRIIADAESLAHGVEISEIHFHEVGTKDAIVDILGVCYAIYLLKPEHISITPVRTGYGSVYCAHGIVPVPSPATAYILRGIPSYSGDIESELCTPTGAALIRHFGESFGQMECMSIIGTGYGMGTKNFVRANCVRAFLGDKENGSDDTITELVCNIDDMTAEALAYSMSKIMAAGVLDITATPVIMKKGRPGYSITVICNNEDTEKAARTMLRETLSNGVRIRRCNRRILTPNVLMAETDFGVVRIKTAEGYGIKHVKPEYADVAKIAEETGKSFCEVHDKITAFIKKEDVH